MAKTKAARRPKQQYIPGTEPPAVPEIDEAAEEYVALRDARMAALKEETQAHDNLLSLMREHGLSSYQFEGYTVSVEEKCKVKVRRSDEED